LRSTALRQVNEGLLPCSDTVNDDAFLGWISESASRAARRFPSGNLSISRALCIDDLAGLLLGGQRAVNRGWPCPHQFERSRLPFRGSLLVLRFAMKMRPSHPFVTFFLGCFWVLCLSTYAGTYSGTVSDLDAGNGYLTVTNPDHQTTQTFKVTSETIIVTSDGKPSQLLDLIEGTRVAVDADPGTGEIAEKITVLPDVSAEPP
jgi:hypothetical protein